VGPVYQAGTLSGNPVAVAAGLATLDLIEREPPFDAMERRAASLSEGIETILSARSVPHLVNRVGSLFSLFFTDEDVRDFAGARSADHAAYARVFHGMLDRDVYLPPSGYEGWFLGAAHSDAEIERVLDAFEACIADGGWRGEGGAA